MIWLNEIEARAKKATSGEWQVITDVHELNELGLKEQAKSSHQWAEYKSYRIFSKWIHGQLGAPTGIVNLSSGPYSSPYYERCCFVVMHKEDADFIAHSRTDIPKLCEALRKAIKMAEYYQHADGINIKAREFLKWLKEQK